MNFILYRWQWRFFYRHYKKEIKLKDLPKPSVKDEADYVHSEFLGYWQAETERARKENRNPNLIYPIFRRYGWRILFMAFCCFTTVSLVFGKFLDCIKLIPWFFQKHFLAISQSLYLADIIQNFDDLNEGKEDARWKIAKVAAFLFFLAVLSKNMKNVVNYFTWLTSLRIRVTLTEMIYGKVRFDCVSSINWHWLTPIWLSIRL